MSASTLSDATSSAKLANVQDVQPVSSPTIGDVQPVESTTPKSNGNYKGFVGGVFSGIAKLSVGYVIAPEPYQFTCS